MAFIKIEGFAGNIYVPETSQGRKKHPCKDCYSCQFCSDERCELCLGNKSRTEKNKQPEAPDNTNDGNKG